ncbi:hypothetical protein JTB14_027978 [Gonioctena quinquepunctata]|nr:hypothetical protein JTB14_027978 [Gonioctena quinquepunctata]
MEDLIRKRGRSKGNITRIENFIAEHENDENLNNNELVIRENILIKAFNDYCRIQDCIEDEDESQIVDREVVEERYVAVHSKLRTLIQKTVNMVSATNEVVAQGNYFRSSQGSPTPKVKLPNLNIPIFTGSYEDWRSFYDLFLALVDKNSNLANPKSFLLEICC